ncbi:MAG: phosphoribosylglycinamide formyltransferase [Microbacteriaceae bacterium]
MYKLLILISGGGSILKAILEAQASGLLAAEVVAVGSDRSVERGASGLGYATEYQVPSFVVNYADYPNREAWGEALLAVIAQHKPDLVVSAGLMRLLPKNVVNALSPQLLNTHPALLPLFPGAHAVRDALAAGVDKTGVSVFIIDEGVDTGPVLEQREVPILPGDTEDVLHERIKVVERQVLVTLLDDIARGERKLGRD